MSDSLVLYPAAKNDSVPGQGICFEPVLSDFSARQASEDVQTRLQTDVGFVNVSEALRVKAEQLAEQQNALALQLLDYPVRTGVIFNRDVWYLQRAGTGRHLQIMAAQYKGGLISCASHRFGQSLEFDPNEEEVALRSLDARIYATASAVLLFENLPLLSVANGAVIHKQVVSDAIALMRTLHQLVDELHATALLRGSAYQAPVTDDCDSRLGRCLEFIQQLRTAASDMDVLPIFDSKLRQLGGVPDLWKYGSRNAQTAQKLRLVLDAGRF